MKRWIVRVGTYGSNPMYVKHPMSGSTGSNENDTTLDVELAHGYHYKCEAAKEADTWSNGRPEKYKKP